MSARPGLCGGHRATGVPTAIQLPAVIRRFPGEWGDWWKVLLLPVIVFRSCLGAQPVHRAGMMRQPSAATAFIANVILRRNPPTR